MSECACHGYYSGDEPCPYCEIMAIKAERDKFSLELHDMIQIATKQASAIVNLKSDKTEAVEAIKRYKQDIHNLRAEVASLTKELKDKEFPGYG